MSQYGKDQLLISDKKLGWYFFNKTLNVRGDLLESLWGMGENKDGGWFIPNDPSASYGSRGPLTRSGRASWNYKPVRPVLEQDLSFDTQGFLDSLVYATCEEVRKFHAKMSKRLYRNSGGHLAGCRTEMLQAQPTKHVAVIDENLVAVSFSRCVWTVMKNNSHLQELATRYISDPLLLSICLPTPKDQITRMFLPIVLLHYMCINPKYEKIFMDIRLASSFLDLQSAYRATSSHMKRHLDYVTGVTLAGIAAQYGIALPNRRILSLPAWLLPRHIHSSRWEGLPRDENYAQGPHSVASQYIRFLLSHEADQTDSKMFSVHNPVRHDQIFRSRIEKIMDAIASGRQKEDRLARTLTSSAFAAMPMTAPLGVGFAPGEYPLFSQKVAPAPMASLLFTCAADTYHHLTHNEPQRRRLNFDDGLESILEDIPRGDFGVRCLYAVCRSLWETREKWLSQTPHVKYMDVTSGEKTENIPLFLLCYNSSPVIPGMLKRDKWDDYMNLENHIHRKLFVNPQWGQIYSLSDQKTLTGLYQDVLESVNLHKTHFRKSDYMIGEWKEGDKKGQTLAFTYDITTKAPLKILTDPDIFRLEQYFASYPYSEVAFISWLERGFPIRLIESGPAIKPEGKAYIKEFGEHPFVHILKNLQDDPIVMNTTQVHQALGPLTSPFRHIYRNDCNVFHVKKSWVGSSERVSPEDLGLVLLSPNHRDLLLKPLIISKDSTVVLRPIDALGKMLDELIFDMGNWGRESLIGLLPSLSILSSPELWDAWRGPERPNRRGEHVSLTLGETAAEALGIFIMLGMRLSLKLKNESRGMEETVDILKNRLASLKEFLPQSLSRVPQDSAKAILRRLYGTPRRAESTEVLVPGLSTRICVSEAVTEDTEDVNTFDEMDVFDATY